MTRWTPSVLVALAITSLACHKSITQKGAGAGKGTPAGASTGIPVEFPRGPLSSDVAASPIRSEEVPTKAGVATEAKVFRGLGEPNGPLGYTSVNGLSADGRVAVGEEGIHPPPQDPNSIADEFPRPPEPPPKAVLWSTRTRRTLPMRRAIATSANGAIVVGEAGAIIAGHPGFQAVRWESDHTTGLGSLGSCGGTGLPGSTAYGLSSDGSVVVGGSTSFEAESQQAFVFSKGRLSGLGDLPGGQFYSIAHAVSGDGSVIVGEATSSRGHEAFRWTRATGMVGLGDLPGGEDNSVAMAVSVDGSVVVGYGFSAEGRRPFRWKNGEMKDMGEVKGGPIECIADAVSADGSIIVGAGNRAADGSTHTAFIWDAPHGMRNLRDVLVQQYHLDLTGWTLYSAGGISADGSTIVGNGRAPDGRGQAWIARLGGERL